MLPNRGHKYFAMVLELEAYTGNSNTTAMNASLLHSIITSWRNLIWWSCKVDTFSLPKYTSLENKEERLFSYCGGCRARCNPH